jgi:AsmA protein
MGKLLKFVGWVIGILVVLVLALVILTPLLFDPNEHKDRIIAEVKQATGRDLSIAGDIGLSVFPWLGLELNGLRLSNPPGFGDSQFAAVDLAKVRVKLMPLLTERTLEADTVQIQGLDLYLATTKEGVTNWEDLAGEQAAADTPAQEPSDAPPGKGLAAFTIGGVSIKDAQVVWDDQRSGQHYQIRDLQLATGPLAPGEPVEVSLELGLKSQQPAMQGQIDLTANLNSKPEQQYFAVQSLQVELELTGEGLPKSGLAATLAGDIHLHHAKGTLDTQDLMLAAGDLVLRAKLQGEDIHTNPRFQGTVKLAPFNPRDWLQAFDISVPTTSDPGVLKKMNLSSGFKATNEQVTFDNLMIELDDTQIKGELALVQPADPTYKFNLDIDQIDLDRYLPPQPEQTQANPAPSQAPSRTPAAQPEASLFPVALLRGLKLDGNLRIGSLTVNKIKAKAVQLKIKAHNGQLRVDQQIGRFYEGMIKGSVGLDVQGNTPKLTIDQDASRILVGPLLMDLADLDKLEGSGNIKANLITTGQTVSQLKRGLHGNLNFTFLDGAVKGVNLAKLLRDARAKIAGETVAVSQEPEQTDFSELSGSGAFNNGVLTNRDLLAKSPFLRVEGSGKVNIVRETLAYSLRTVLVNTPQGQGGKGLEELVGVPIPVDFEGPWSKPKWKIDLAKVLAEHQKAKLKQQVEEKVREQLPELQEKLPEELKDKLPGALKGLF